MSFTRNDVAPNTYYFDKMSKQFFYSPDGEGCVFYETFGEMDNEVGLFNDKVIKVTLESSF